MRLSEEQIVARRPLSCFASWRLCARVFCQIKVELAYEFATIERLVDDFARDAQRIRQEEEA